MRKFLVAGIMILLGASGSLAVINVKVVADKMVLACGESTAIRILAQGTDAGLYSLSGDIVASGPVGLTSVPDSLVWVPEFVCNIPIPPGATTEFGTPGTNGGWSQFWSRQPSPDFNYARSSYVEVASYTVTALGTDQAPVVLEFRLGDYTSPLESMECDYNTAIGLLEGATITVLPASVTSVEIPGLVGWHEAGSQQELAAAFDAGLQFSSIDGVKLCLSAQAHVGQEWLPGDSAPPGDPEDPGYLQPAPVYADVSLYDLNGIEAATLLTREYGDEQFSEIYDVTATSGWEFLRNGRGSIRLVVEQLTLVPGGTDMDIPGSLDITGAWLLIDGQVAPVVVTPVDDASVLEGTTYQANLTLSQGDPPVAWSLVSGPAGMSIDPDTGVVVWPEAATAGSPYQVIVRATTALGSDDESWQLTVTPRRRIYVSTAGNNSNNGLSWATAVRDLGMGLTLAAAGDQVWVAAGTYVEGQITLKNDVALYGGFNGTETDLSQRDWATNVTVLDGNHRFTVVSIGAGAQAGTRIDGFTICNGDAVYGGGIRCGRDSFPAIQHNTITDNSAGGSPGGGGIYCGEGSAPTVTNNTITNNTVTGSDELFRDGRRDLLRFWLVACHCDEYDCG